MSKSKSGGPEEEERNGSSSATATTTTTTNSSYDAEAEAWSRVQLLRARLRAAAAAEDYEAASALRDALAAAVDALPLPQRHVLSALDAASSSLSTSSLDRASALLRAADHVRPYAFAQLATFLHDPDAGVAAAAERSLATAFRVPPDEAAAARMDEGDRALEQAATMMALGGGRGGAAAMEEEEDEEEATTSSSSGGLLPRRRQRSRGRSRSELLQRALAAYSACAELHPLYAEAHNAKATALYVAGDPVASLRACEVVLDLNPHHFSCAAGAGMCFIALGKHDEALACLEVALEINPNLEHVAATAARMRKQRDSSSSVSSSSSSSDSSSQKRSRLPWLAAREAAARAKAEEEGQEE